MHLTTRVLKRIDTDPETGDLVEEIATREANVHTDASVLIEQIKRGDHRVIGSRVFEFSVDDDGNPLIGDELT